jgi:hypothetical protein
MAKLSEDVKSFIVKQLAMYDTPTQVAEAVKERFGLEVTRQQVRAYDPGAGVRIMKKWHVVFDATRKNFLEHSGEIPIANRAVRLRRLERMAVAAESKKNYPLAAQLHEQAAKECGDYYSRSAADRPSVNINVDLADLNDAQLEHLANGGSVATLPR